MRPQRFERPTLRFVVIAELDDFEVIVTYDLADQLKRHRDPVAKQRDDVGDRLIALVDCNLRILWVDPRRSEQSHRVFAAGGLDEERYGLLIIETLRNGDTRERSVVNN